MSGYTAKLGNRLARLGRIVLGEAPVVVATTPAWLPLLVVEFSPTTGATGTPVWVDITTSTVSFTVSRGASTDLDRIETGTCTLVLANDERRFDPTNAYGPYYGQLVPRKRVRIRAIWAGVSYPVFTGYVETWNPPLWRHGKAVTSMKAVDGLGIMALKQVSGAYVQQRTDERIAAILTAAGWSTGQGWLLGDATYGVLGTTTIPAPVGDQALSTGQTTVQAQTLDNVTALTHLQLMQRSEQGFLFVSAGGAFMFRSRHELLYTKTVLSVFGTEFGEVPYADAEIDATGKDITNEVKVTRIGGTEQTASDATSQAAYFTITEAITGLPLLTDTESGYYANFRLSRDKDFRVTVTGVALEPQASPSVCWPVALVRDVGDRVRVRYRPDTGSDMDATAVIARVGHTYQAERAAWVTEFSLTPASTVSAWVLGTSLLGSESVPAY